jgi:hypothetical protein
MPGGSMTRHQPVARSDGNRRLAVTLFGYQRRIHGRHPDQVLRRVDHEIWAHSIRCHNGYSFCHRHRKRAVASTRTEVDPAEIESGVSPTFVGVRPAMPGRVPGLTVQVGHRSAAVTEEVTIMA